MTTTKLPELPELEQAALAVYFANCQGIKSDPLPMLRKILALGEGDRRDAERYRLVITCGRLPTKTTAGYHWLDGVSYPTPEACLDAAIAAIGAGVEGGR